MEKIIYRQKGAVGYMFFNRPDKWNAMDTGMLDEIQALLDRLAGDETVRMLVISGEGKSFSSGVDLKALQTLDTVDEAKRFARLLESTAERIFGFPKPTLAVINGLALGGGFGMATAADIRLISTEARVGYPAVKLGAILPAGCTLLLESLVGRAKAMDLLLTGRQLDAPQALEMGLVHYIAEPEALEKRTAELAATILEGGDTALQLTKQTINYRTQLLMQAATLYATDNFAYLSQTPDWEQRLKNFGKE